MQDPAAALSRGILDLVLVSLKVLTTLKRRLLSAKFTKNECSFLRDSTCP